ncbi:hypothetical protein AB1Y20_008285 [Prymnesium parvum]|uniref:CHAT domain-containing protein n=1 Tax=Prymnesium parvum TaxID=97485 RepID=A0AB34IW19_PRYPA
MDEEPERTSRSASRQRTRERAAKRALNRRSSRMTSSKRVSILIEQRRLRQEMQSSKKYLSFSVISRDLLAQTGHKSESSAELADEDEAMLREDSERLLIISKEVNQKLRQQVLLQSRFTNRFRGSVTAKRAEEQYALYVTSYQLDRVKHRLASGTFVYVVTQTPDPIIYSDNIAFIIVRVAVPVGLLLFAALCCHLERTREHWRAAVMLASTLGYAAIAFADFLQDMSNWTPCQKDYNTMWQLVWFLVGTQMSSIFFSLDLAYVMVVLLVQWLTFASVCITLWARWWVDTHQGEFTWEILWRSPLHQLQSLIVLTPNGTLNTTQVEIPNENERVSARILLDCIILSTIIVSVLYAAVRRVNRFERQSFINAFVLINKVSTQQSKLAGKSIELLALFSNPRTPLHGPQLKPLALGQELKFLLKSVPAYHIAVEPAAAFGDVSERVKEHNPRIILFSGHSFMGSLAFELPNGRIDLPSSQEFVFQLRKECAPRLQCVFLNGCQTAELGYQLVDEMPWLMCICWVTITEDAAARAFAQGFYDAVGAFINEGEEVKVELAFWAGLERFASENFQLGDPAKYLHHPAHPHSYRPVLNGECKHCCPPVHGTVVLFRKGASGHVERMRMGLNETLAAGDEPAGRKSRASARWSHANGTGGARASHSAPVWARETRHSHAAARHSQRNSSLSKPGEPGGRPFPSSLMTAAAGRKTSINGQQEPAERRKVSVDGQSAPRDGRSTSVEERKQARGGRSASLDGRKTSVEERKADRRRSSISIRGLWSSRVSAVSVQKSAGANRRSSNAAELDTSIFNWDEVSLQSIRDGEFLSHFDTFISTCEENDDHGKSSASCLPVVMTVVEEKTVNLLELEPSLSSQLVGASSSLEAPPSSAAPQESVRIDVKVDSGDEGDIVEST